MIRVLLADDQALVRSGFRLILERDDEISVVGEAANGADAFALGRELAPDVVLMDVRMPVLDGIAATRRLVDDPAFGGRVLMLTTFDLDEYVFDAIRAGASGFLLKDVLPVDLLHAVRLVHRGEAMLAPSLTRRLLEEFLGRPRMADRASTPFADLTEREHEVARAVARGALERRDRQGAVPQRGDREVTCHTCARQAPCARPRADRRRRVRVGTDPARRQLRRGRT